MKENILIRFKENKFNFYLFLKFLLYALIFFLSANVKIAGNIMPCFYGLFLSILF